MNKQIFTFAFAAAVALASCSKDEATTPTPTPTPDPKPTPSSAATPTYGSGDGAVVALLTRTTTSSFGVDVDMDLGTGVAVFGNLATGAYTDAGKITLNGTELAKQTNNSYLFIPGVSNPTGIDLSGAIKWVTPSFTYDASSAAGGRGMPKAGKIDGTYTSVDISKDFTLSVSGTITRSDSVYFQINGASKSILKRMAAGTTSVTFTASELAGLGKTAGGSVTIAPWNHEEQTLGGKKIHVINELALSRTVEIK